ncbi:MAG TPA: hypothetical protein VNX70_20065 [Bryobacteraceae bacterium]|nr:hypothetical protein [Bryobacteraceae bacterium]
MNSCAGASVDVHHELLAFGDSRPEFRGDDTKLRLFNDPPFVARPLARDAFVSSRSLHELSAIPDALAGVQFIAEHRPYSRGTPGRARLPFPWAWRRNALGVELSRDGLQRHSIRGPAEDANHNRGLGFVDHQTDAIRSSFIPITEASATSV